MRNLFILSLLLISCVQNPRTISFEQTKWQEKNDLGVPSPYRQQMIESLLENYKLSGLSVLELHDLLGEPDIVSDSILVYKIVEEYGKDIDPIYTKDLRFSVQGDSLITGLELKEWRK